MNEWHRLSSRTLLTGPLKAVRSVGLPVIVAVIGFGSARGLLTSAFVLLAGVAIALVAGALPWATTWVRLTDSHLEVRRGLLHRTTVTARRDRVRSVDLESHLLHQALNLAVVKIGTGVDDGQIELDALAITDAETLRRALLHGEEHLTPPITAAATATATATATADYQPTPADPAAPMDQPTPTNQPTPLAVLDWSWLRFAPLNLLNLALAAGAIGAVASQAGDLLGSVVGLETAEDVLALGVPLVAIGVIVVAVAVWVPAACAGYALRWFNLRVTREPGKHGPNLHQQAGLFTTRATTVEEAKVRGVSERRQLLIAAAGGAELSLLTIGMEDTTPAILPAAPLDVVRRLAADVLGDAAPLAMPVLSHGPRARRRYLRRAAIDLGLLALVLVAATVGLRLLDVAWPWWVTAAVVVLASPLRLALALLKIAHLGHGVTDRYVVTQSGSLVRTRTVLEIAGIVGWRVTQNPFDRHLGLAQLTATTSAGDEAVVIADIPLAQATALIRRATPQLLSSLSAP